MKNTTAILLFLSLFGGIGCNNDSEKEEPIPGLLPTTGKNQSQGCGTASLRTAALDATLTLLPQKGASIVSQGNCLLAADGAHFTTFTRIYYSVDATTNLVCAIVDSYQDAASDVTAVTSLFYAEWYAVEATSPTWSGNCGGPFPSGVTNTNEVCLPPGFAHPVTGAQAFDDLMKGKIAKDVFAGCTWAYASPFTE